MKNIRHITKGDAFDNRLEISNHHVKVPKSKLSSGSVVDSWLLQSKVNIEYLKSQ
ncbi:MAG: hypothetical protein WCK84_13885 [Bacteroidota bacterium]